MQANNTKFSASLPKSKFEHMICRQTPKFLDQSSLQMVSRNAAEIKELRFPQKLLLDSRDSILKNFHTLCYLIRYCIWKIQITLTCHTTPENLCTSQNYSQNTKVVQNYKHFSSYKFLHWLFYKLYRRLTTLNTSLI